MVVPARKEAVSYAAYAGAEAASSVKYEWFRGEVFAKAGGTPEHAALAMAVAREVGVALLGRPCRVYSSDVRIFVPDAGLATYPDLSVVCGRLETAPEDPQSITNPTLIVEVLSSSTEAYDRGEKFAHYRRLSSLREYVLVSQKERRIEVFRRTAAGRWELEEAGPGGSVVLTSIECAISVDAVYFDPLGAASST